MHRIEYYDNYRHYLKDYYEDRKARFPYFSYRYFCQKAKIKSPSLFKDVVEGKRNLTPRTIEAFCKGMSLTERDSRFFTALVGFNQAKTSKEKQQYLETMRELRQRINQEVVPIDKYEYYSKWYHVVIRELACCIDWNENHEVLAKAVRPPITVRQARESIQFLLDSGFLIRTSEGSYRQSNPAITSGTEVTSFAVRKFNQLMANRGAEAVDTMTPDERDIRSMVIGISPRSYKLIKDEMREFLDRIVRIVHDDKSAQIVYNMNIQLFPLSSSPKNQKDRNDSEIQE